MKVREMISGARVVPIVTVYDEKEGLNLVKALAAGGVKAFEITLRSPFGLDTITKAKANFPELKVGAGTVTTAREFEAALKAGADFVVTPGINAKFASDIAAFKAPVLVGASTAGEIMLAADYGHYTLKFYHALASGGVVALKAFAKPFSQVKFVPAGGIDATNAREFLALENVLALASSSWINPKELVLDKNYERITAVAKKALEI